MIDLFLESLASVLDNYFPMGGGLLCHVGVLSGGLMSVPRPGSDRYSRVYRLLCRLLTRSQLSLHAAQTADFQRP